MISFAQNSKFVYCLESLSLKFVQGSRIVHFIPYPHKSFDHCHSEGVPKHRLPSLSLRTRYVRPSWLHGRPLTRATHHLWLTMREVNLRCDKVINIVLRWINVIVSCRVQCFYCTWVASVMMPIINVASWHMAHYGNSHLGSLLVMRAHTCPWILNYKCII